MPAYPTAAAGAATEVEPEEKKRPSRRLTSPDDPNMQVSKDEFQDLVSDLGLEVCATLGMLNAGASTNLQITVNVTATSSITAGPSPTSSETPPATETAASAAATRRATCRRPLTPVSAGAARAWRSPRRPDRAR